LESQRVVLLGYCGMCAVWVSVEESNLTFDSHLLAAVDLSLPIGPLRVLCPDVGKFNTWGSAERAFLSRGFCDDLM
jgi:hypothetical protein